MLCLCLCCVFVLLFCVGVCVWFVCLFVVFEFSLVFVNAF